MFRKTLLSKFIDASTVASMKKEISQMLNWHGPAKRSRNNKETDFICLTRKACRSNLLSLQPDGSAGSIFCVMCPLKRCFFLLIRTGSTRSMSVTYCK